jgi:hypothetical protein
MSLQHPMDEDSQYESRVLSSDVKLFVSKPTLRLLNIVGDDLWNRELLRRLNAYD